MTPAEGGGRAATEPKADRRRALVFAAYRRIATDGFEGLRTRDVAADVGVNIATLHYYFPTKEALIRSVIGHAMERFIDTFTFRGQVQELRQRTATLACMQPGEQVLDVGCGGGLFLHMLREQGLPVLGLETSRQAAVASPESAATGCCRRSTSPPTHWCH